MSYESVSDDVQFEAQARAEPRVDANAANIRTNIVKVSDAMSEFDAVSAGLAELAARFPVDVVYDVSTGKGMVEAVAHRAAWRDPRLAVERLRKQAKAPVIALGKDIDARAAWLTEQLLLGERPIDEQIKAEEARKEAIRLKKINDEFARTQAIQDAIAEIHMDAMTLAGKPSATIAAGIEAMRSMVLEPMVFQDQMAQAQAAKAAALAKLDLAHKAALHTEAEAAKLAADRAELEQLRKAAAEAAAAKAIADEAQRAAQRAEAARLAEERAAIDKAQRESADRIAAQQAEIDRQRAELEAASRPAPPVVVVASAAATTPEAGTLNAGTICKRLGFMLTVDFIINELGLPPVTREGRATLWSESQFRALCTKLAAHVAAVARGEVEVTA